MRGRAWVHSAHFFEPSGNGTLRPSPSMTISQRDFGAGWGENAAHSDSVPR